MSSKKNCRVKSDSVKKSFLSIILYLAFMMAVGEMQLA